MVTFHLLAHAPLTHGDISFIGPCSFLEFTPHSWRHFIYWPMHPSLMPTFHLLAHALSSITFYFVLVQHYFPVVHNGPSIMKKRDFIMLIKVSEWLLH